MEQRPVSVWRHSFPRVTSWNDKKNGGKIKRAIMGQQYVSHESEDILKAQFFRDRESGLRQKPPKKCPFSFFLQWVQDAIDIGDLSWTRPLFRFEVTNETDEGPVTEVRLIHAGGIVGMFGKKDMTTDEKIELKNAGIILRVDGKPWEGAWAQNATAKQSFVFPIVDDSAPDKGIQITIESKLVQQSVAAVIKAYREDLYDPKTKMTVSKAWDPFTEPYCIQWKYNPNPKNFNETYVATKVGQVQITDQIKELISGEKPDLSRDTDPFNPKSLRSVFEAHCVIDGIPWDDFFGAFAEREQPQLNQGRGRVPEVGRGIDSAPPTPHNTGVAAPLSPPPPVDEQICPECGADNDCPHVACDACDKPVLQTDASCKHCGLVFVAPGPSPVSAAHVPQPVPPPVAKKVAPPLPQAPLENEFGVGFGGVDNEDDIPF